MTRNTQVLVVGFGNMGQALVRGWLARGHDARAIHVVDPVAGAREAAVALGVSAAERVGSVPGLKPKIVVLAVKPNQLAGVLGECRAVAGGDAVSQVMAAIVEPTAAQVGRHQLVQDLGRAVVQRPGRRPVAQRPGTANQTVARTRGPVSGLSHRSDRHECPPQS